MAFRVFRGKTKKVYLPVTTSTAFAKNSLVEMTSGLVGVADDNDTALAGMIDKAIVSTDADYASSRRVGITVPVEQHVIWECNALSGTFSASDIGGEYGISDAVTLDQTDTTNKVFLITEFINTSLVRGYLKINGSY